jgi:hypothetical protein
MVKRTQTFYTSLVETAIQNIQKDERRFSPFPRRGALKPVNALNASIHSRFLKASPRSPFD